MKTMIAALAAVATVTAVAAPAAAQPYRDYNRWERGHDNINARQAELQRRIDHGVRRGLLSQREFQELRSDIRSINSLERAYRSDGRLTARERTELNRRLDWSEARLENRLDRQYGYGYGQRR